MVLFEKGMVQWDEDLSILPFHPAGRVWEHFFLPIDLCQKKFSRVRGGQGIT